MKKLALALMGVLAVSACDTGTSYTSGGGGYNRVVDITNTSGVTMTHFYASNSGESSWGPEQLGASTVLPNNQYVTINFDDGTGACSYDFRAKFANGQTLIRYNINVCAVSSYDYF